MTQLITQKQAAERLKVSPLIVARLERDGMLPAVCLKNKPARYRSQDVDAFLAGERTVYVHILRAL